MGLILLFGLPFLAWGLIGDHGGSGSSADDGPDSTDTLPDYSGSAEITPVDSTIFKATDQADQVVGTQADEVVFAGGGSDCVSGGDGNDQLAGDKGDVMTGGAGKDDFGVFYVSGDDPVTINDYNPAEDTLSVSHLGTSALPTSVVDVSGGAMLHLAGEPVALLAGVKAADVDLSKVMQDY